MSITYTIHDTAPAPETDVVDAGLDAYNIAEGYIHEVRRLCVFARGQGGRVMGGAVGRTWNRCCELQQIWVSDEQRHRGVGAALMQQFEQEALRRGCTLVYLDTFSFHAPEFYRKLGYRVALETRGFGHGIAKFTMQKELAPA